MCSSGEVTAERVVFDGKALAAALLELVVLEGCGSPAGASAVTALAAVLGFMPSPPTPPTVSVVQEVSVTLLGGPCPGFVCGCSTVKGDGHSRMQSERENVFVTMGSACR